MYEALELIKKKLVNVLAELEKFALAHKDLPVLAFTHFQPAQPTTLGKRAAIWAQDLLLDYEELCFLLENKKLRGQAVSAALGIELLLTLIMCFGKGTQMVLLNMTPTLRIEMNVDVIGCIFSVLMSTMWLPAYSRANTWGMTTTSVSIRCSTCACCPR